MAPTADDNERPPMSRPLAQFAPSRAGGGDNDEDETRQNRVRARLAEPSTAVASRDSAATVYESSTGHRKLTLSVGGTANVYAGT